MAHGRDTGSDFVEMGDIEEEIQTQLKEEFNKHGLLGTKCYIERQIDNWKMIPLSIAVTGRAGVGKSSFINTIRGVEHGDTDYAPVGCTETTIEVKSYKHPRNQLLRFFDLPGCGTSDFPRKTYCTTDERIQFKTYDLYIIMLSERVNEDDIWLAREILKIDKRFIFVRSKINQEVTNACEERHVDSPDEMSSVQKVVISEIRTEMHKTLQSLQTDNSSVQVYLIDSHKSKNPLYDFDELINAMINECPDFKKDAMIHSLSGRVMSLIDAKEKLLRKCIWMHAALVVAALPMYAQNDAKRIDKFATTAVIDMFKHEFGLEENEIKQIAHFHHIPMEIICGLAVTFQAEHMEIVMNSDIEVDFENSIANLATKIGISSVISFTVTYRMLSKALTVIAEDARKVQREIAKQATK